LNPDLVNQPRLANPALAPNEPDPAAAVLGFG
jgi:hypothetical protein